MSPAPKGPDRVSVRMYQVGFGDCFLVSFGYSQPTPSNRSERHVLIDFGSTRWPTAKVRYGDIANDIAARTDGQLDAVVLTHRHKDHLGGFGDPKAGATIASLKPSLVVRPWTEDPKAAADATGSRHIRDESFRFAASLDNAEAFASEVYHAMSKARGLRGDLADLAFDQVGNQKAIERLDSLASDARLAPRYVHAGVRSGLESVLPGVTVSVLGPPTVDQWPQVAGERENDPEYWLRHQGLLDHMLVEANASRPVRTVATQAAKTTTTKVDPGPLRWLVERMRDEQAHSLMRIVRTLDDAMNNTSVILLFQVGERRLLFPGDAQIENWSYALTAPNAAKLRQHLSDVDFYKVGHHGSRNATPRSLFALWQKRRIRLTSAMSTLPGVHGKTPATAVPRTTLVTALGGLGRVHRTDHLAQGQLYLDLSAPTTDQKGFAATAS